MAQNERDVIIDIETIGDPVNELSEEEFIALTRGCTTPEEYEEALGKMALIPHTAQIVSIGMYNPHTKKGMVFFQDRSEVKQSFTEKGIFFSPVATERELLIQFWEHVKKYKRAITFNGRKFDHPVIYYRSMKHRLPIEKELIGYRYKFDTNPDLYEVITNFGLIQGYSLDFNCRRLGITSPKTKEQHGSLVSELFAAGNYAAIARYNGDDVIATAELYLLWKQYFIDPLTKR